MLESFHKTAKVSDIIVNTERRSITGIINDIFKDNPGYDFYHITNDDFVYKTDGWDLIFANLLNFKGGGIAYGDDKMSKGIPTAPFISREIAEAVGWLQMPTLKHLYGDTVWKYIGEKLNRLYYVKDVVIKHNHYMNNSAERDAVYERTNSTEMYRKDQAAYREWVKHEATNDINYVELEMSRLREAGGL